MDKFSYVGNGDVNAIEELYKNYQNDPESVDFGWKKFFEGFDFSRTSFEDNGEIPQNVQKEFKVIELINDYRSRGHLFTKTNPVRTRRSYSPTLDIEYYGLEQADLESEFSAGAEIGLGKAKLKDIVQHLEDTYCASIGIEYMYIRKPEVIKWIQEKIEPNKNQANFTSDEKKRIFKRICQAVEFEGFLHKKFVGQKRFSLEGGESLIPSIYYAVEKGVNLGIKEFVIGMAHRGRLNILANIFKKPFASIFSEFEGKEYEEDLFDGDVKYHLGYSRTRNTENGKMVHLTLSPNPSHLEAVGPVVEGLSRSKINNHHSGDVSKVCPIIIHGDASIAGQGIVYETVQMAGLKGYKAGGSLHIVVNNQIGFTTNYIDGRTSTYCTDVGKVTLSPVFHVNGDDTEAVVHTILLAMEYRQTFGTDVFVDLLCYRKYGHNEGDEPRFTQPILYKAIAKHPNPKQLYLKQLVDENSMSPEEAKKVEEEYTNSLQYHLDQSKKTKTAEIEHFMQEIWFGYKEAPENAFDASPKTGVNKRTLLSLGKKLTSLPEDKAFFRKIVKLTDDRAKMLEGDGKLDWAMGELLAYATLLNEGHNVRISGQDVERGTFSHRHAVLTLEESEEKYVPLKNLSKKQGRFSIYNSLLSEYAVLGFEYGYSMATPDDLIIWEAQFGDFNNGAQIIIDQFLSAAEDKWRTQNGLVMLLPHGYEGQGAEHSSARMERYLQLCAEDNLQLVNCTTPANFFHVLRRQLAWPFRKPLIVFTPKSLLRHPECVSTISDLTSGGFQEVLDDPGVKDKSKVKKVMFCQGKIYYDLIKERRERKLSDTAIVRLEQIYPLPVKQLEKVIADYKNAETWKWVQEEPMNMGAWSFMLRHFTLVPLEVVGRPDSASPATGSSQQHAKRFKALMNEAFN
jgi:2-oxoglutarate dehydrogenase E1 component